MIGSILWEQVQCMLSWDAHAPTCKAFSHNSFICRRLLGRGLCSLQSFLTSPQNSTYSLEGLCKRNVCVKTWCHCLSSSISSLWIWMSSSGRGWEKEASPWKERQGSRSDSLEATLQNPGRMCRPNQNNRDITLLSLSKKTGCIDFNSMWKWGWCWELARRRTNKKVESRKRPFWILIQGNTKLNQVDIVLVSTRHKLLLQEFEYCGMLRVTMATVNL